MSGPPPGYNPSDSMLQGGSATITPVMGGGGMFGGAAPENVSLLSGGDAARIEGVQGGGDGSVVPKRDRGVVGKLLGARRGRSRSRSRSKKALKGGGAAEMAALQAGIQIFLQTNNYKNGVMNEKYPVRKNAGIYIIDRQGRVAIHRRSDPGNEELNGKISTAGGAVDPTDRRMKADGKEDPIGGVIAALREAEEEIGYKPLGLVDFKNLNPRDIANIQGLVNTNTIVKFYSKGGIETHLCLTNQDPPRLEDNPSHGREVDTAYDFREFGTDPAKIRKVNNGVAFVDIGHAINVIRANYKSLGYDASFLCLQLLKAIQDGGANRISPKQMEQNLRALYPRGARPAPPAGAPVRAPPAVAPGPEDLDAPEDEEEAADEAELLKALDAGVAATEPKPRAPRQQFKATDSAKKSATPLRVSQEDIPALPAGEAEVDMKEYETLRKRYIEEQSKLWKRYGPKQVTIMEQAIPLKLEKCGLFNSGFLPTTGLDDEDGQEGFDRLGIVLDKTIKKMFLFPPMKGDLDKTRRCLSLFKAVPSHDVPAVAIFAPPFLGDDELTNKKQMAEFMRLKLNLGLTSKKDLYILTEQTMKNRLKGCGLHKPQAFKVEGPMVNFLEPTYILYPFPRTIITDETNVEKGGLVFTAAGKQETAYLPASKSKRMVSLVDFFHDGGRGPIAIQPNTTVEGTALRTPFPLIKTRFYGADKLNFTEEQLTQYEIFDFEDPALEVGEAEESDSVVLVPLADTLYRIRKAEPGVIKDWETGKFTKEEGEFLGGLNLRVELLEDVFESDAQILGEEPDKYAFKQLAQFMAAMVSSKCFTDTRLMTYRECEVPRKFMEKVYNYYLLHDDRVSGLGEAEQEEIRQQLQLRAATAEEKALYAQQSADKVISDARAVLERYKKETDSRLKAVGADSTATPGGDPFSEGAVEGKGKLAAGDAKPEDTSGPAPSAPLAGGGHKWRQSGGMDIALGANPIIYDYENERVFARKFISVNKLTGVYREGFAEVEADSPEESRALLTQKMEELRRDYPNYIFME